MSSTGYDHNSRPEMLQFIPQGCERLLDVGCHAGSFGKAAKEKYGVEVWGVEPNPDAAAIASQNIDKVEVGPFEDGLDIPDKYFDAVIFNDVLEHLVSPQQALQLAKTKLRTNGVIVASIPNMRHIDNLEHLLFERDWRYELSGTRDSTHLRFFTRKSMVRMFEECGLKIITVVGINAKWWVREKWIRRFVFRMCTGATEDLRYVQYAIVARRECD